MNPGDRVARADDLILAEVDSEAVALSAARGVCYSLNGVGLRILQLMEAPARISEICARLVAEYEIDARTCEIEVTDLLAELEGEGLVAVDRRGQTS